MKHKYKIGTILKAKNNLPHKDVKMGEIVEAKVVFVEEFEYSVRKDFDYTLEHESGCRIYMKEKQLEMLNEFNL